MGGRAAAQERAHDLRRVHGQALTVWRARGPAAGRPAERGLLAFTPPPTYPPSPTRSAFCLPTRSAVYLPARL